MGRRDPPKLKIVMKMRSELIWSVIPVHNILRILNVQRYVRYAEINIRMPDKIVQLSELSSLFVSTRVNTDREPCNAEKNKQARAHGQSS